MEPAQDIGMPLGALLGVRSTVQDLSSRLQHCLEDLLTLQAETDNAQVTRCESACLTPNGGDVHDMLMRSKFQGVNVASSHGISRAGSETWVRISAHQRPQTSPYNKTAIAVPSGHQSLVVNSVELTSSCSGTTMIIVDGSSHAEGEVNPGVVGTKSIEISDSRSVGSLLEDFEAQLRASEVPDGGQEASISEKAGIEVSESPSDKELDSDWYKSETSKSESFLQGEAIFHS